MGFIFHHTTLFVIAHQTTVFSYHFKQQLFHPHTTFYSLGYRKYIVWSKPNHTHLGKLKSLTNNRFSEMYKLLEGYSGCCIYFELEKILWFDSFFCFVIISTVFVISLYKSRLKVVLRTNVWFFLLPEMKIHLLDAGEKIFSVNLNRDSSRILSWITWTG